ncbi:DAS1 (YJL149W) [Zygosaccharomyces parabailii]|nr:DAS1 (YJL149W) [Zygosaccharomyces parabailii]CDH15698.1 related to F-box protein DAS1 [Zygosaccharomyces bailii ISA1307]SJM88240.1 related to F-box protein DAS1 [Zygosaccharomyces bailii]
MDSEYTDTEECSFPLQRLSDDLLQEVFSHLPQQDRLTACLIDKRSYRLATKLVYRRIYLNDSNVVRSDYMNLAINWTLLNIPSFLSEEESRKIANAKLVKLIWTLSVDKFPLNCVQWIRINWDLDSALQRSVLAILCSRGQALQRLENVTDPSCNDIISSGTISTRKVISFDMAPPNSQPESPVPEDYIPNLQRYMRQRMSSRLSHMTLFMDPIKLFNYLHPLTSKLQIVDLKLHWRREFYDPKYFMHKIRSKPLTKLSEVFDVRTLKVLTIISWNEWLVPREVQMIRDFKEFVYLEDLSLISIKQNFETLMTFFYNFPRLKRLKMDFLEDLIPETTRPEIFLTILFVCKKLQFIDMRFEGMDSQIISLHEDKFMLNQKCHCSGCMHVFENILRKKIFMFPEDRLLVDLHDIAAKDIFKMMRFLSLLPYSKACDCYPSVRTQPMNLEQFVKKMNEELFYYRRTRGQLVCNDMVDEEGNIERFNKLPHEPLTKEDVIECYHAMIHHYRTTYISFLKGFPELRFLMLNDIPTVVVEEDGERIFQPIFFHYDYKTNLTGWSKRRNKKHRGNREISDSVTRKATVF